MNMRKVSSRRCKNEKNQTSVLTSEVSGRVASWWNLIASLPVTRYKVIVFISSHDILNFSTKRFSSLDTERLFSQTFSLCLVLIYSFNKHQGVFVAGEGFCVCVGGVTVVYFLPPERFDLSRPGFSFGSFHSWLFAADGLRGHTAILPLPESQEASDGDTPAWMSGADMNVWPAAPGRPPPSSTLCV